MIQLTASVGKCRKVSASVGKCRQVTASDGTSDGNWLQVTARRRFLRQNFLPPIPTSPAAGGSLHLHHGGRRPIGTARHHRRPPIHCQPFTYVPSSMLMWKDGQNRPILCRFRPRSSAIAVVHKICHMTRGRSTFGTAIASTPPQSSLILPTV